MIGKIIEGISRITQGTYNVTGVRKCCTYGTEDENPDSLMLIC